jgi:hypothetical protein
VLKVDVMEWKLLGALEWLRLNVLERADGLEW